MNDNERRVLEAAKAFVIWANKVPSPRNYNEEYDRLHDELQNAVQALYTNEMWWNLTWAPDGWPES